MAKKKAKGRGSPRIPSRPKPRKRRAAAAPRAEPAPPPRNKTEACLALLLRPEGASIEDLNRLTGWLPHSVRGFLAGTVKKMAGLVLTSEKRADAPRRYRVSRAQDDRRKP